MEMKRKITLFEGDGIGPEITAAVVRVLANLDLPIEYERCDIGQTAFEKTGVLIPDEAVASLRRNQVALKAPVTTPIGKGFRSVNVQLRLLFDLYANIRPAKSHTGLATRFQDVDLVVFRENTEDLYIGEETKVSDEEMIAVKRITKKASERIIRAAFDYAVDHKRELVTCVHKANILKLTDGLFLSEFNRIKEEYPLIRANDLIIDNCCMQLVMRPEQYDVMVMPNLYGDIVSDLTSGLTGGAGLAPGVNRNEKIAVFEAVHGSAPDIAGQNIANPTALLLSACMMLDHLSFGKEAAAIRDAVERALEKPEFRTKDLGGTASTTEFTDGVIAFLQAM
jgi:isocitrate dehydrogenase (NAD+)